MQQGESPLRYADDMFIPWLYTALPPGTSLAYRIFLPSPPVRIYIWTLKERHFKGANGVTKKKASQQLLAAGGMIATVRLQSVI